MAHTSFQTFEMRWGMSSMSLIKEHHVCILQAYILNCRPFIHDYYFGLVWTVFSFVLRVFHDRFKSSVLAYASYQLPNNVMFYYYKCLFEKTSQQFYLVDFNMFFGRRGGGRWRPWVAVITVYHCYYIVITYIRRAFYQRLQFCIGNLLLKCMEIIFNAVQHR